MSQAALVQLTQRSNFSEPLTLLQSLEDAEFSYFGRRHRQTILQILTFDSVISDTRLQQCNDSPSSQKVRIQWSSGGEVISWLVDLVQPVEGQLAAMMPEGFDI